MLFWLFFSLTMFALIDCKPVFASLKYIDLSLIIGNFNLLRFRLISVLISSQICCCSFCFWIKVFYSVVSLLIRVWNLKIDHILCNLLLVFLIDWTRSYFYLGALILSAAYFLLVCWNLKILWQLLILLLVFISWYYERLKFWSLIFLFFI